MKLQVICIAIFLLFTASVSATTYTWVDENGKKHFGDVLPAKYKESAVIVKEKSVNTMEIESTNSAAGKVLEKRADAANRSDKDFALPLSSADFGSCELQQKAFAASKSCFKKCKTKNKNGRAAKASCAACENVMEPNCAAADERR